MVADAITNTGRDDPAGPAWCATTHRSRLSTRATCEPKTPVLVPPMSGVVSRFLAWLRAQARLAAVESPKGVQNRNICMQAPRCGTLNISRS
jgi:hypothetical protein